MNFLAKSPSTSHILNNIIFVIFFLSFWTSAFEPSSYVFGIFHVLHSIFECCKIVVVKFVYCYNEVYILSGTSIFSMINFTWFSIFHWVFSFQQHCLDFNNISFLKSTFDPMTLVWSNEIDRNHKNHYIYWAKSFVDLVDQTREPTADSAECADWPLKRISQL